MIHKLKINSIDSKGKVLGWEHTDLGPWKILSPPRTLPVRLRSFSSKLSPHFDISDCASAFLRGKKKTTTKFGNMADTKFVVFS